MIPADLGPWVVEAVALAEGEIAGVAEALEADDEEVLEDELELELESEAELELELEFETGAIEASDDVVDALDTAVPLDEGEQVVSDVQDSVDVALG